MDPRWWGSGEGSGGAHAGVWGAQVGDGRLPFLGGLISLCLHIWSAVLPPSPPRCHHWGQVGKWCQACLILELKCGHMEGAGHTCGGWMMPRRTPRGHKAKNSMLLGLWRPWWWNMRVQAGKDRDRLAQPHLAQGSSILRLGGVLNLGALLIVWVGLLFKKPWIQILFVNFFLFLFPSCFPFPG